MNDCRHYANLKFLVNITLAAAVMDNRVKIANINVDQDATEKCWSVPRLRIDRGWWPAVTVVESRSEGP